MKLKEIRPIAVSIPMSEPTKVAGVELRNSDNVLVRIETDNGIVGWGEAASAPSMTGETVESMMVAVRYLAPHLCGIGFDDIGAVSKRMNRLMYGNKAAKSAIEIGLHDALGKAQGKPVHDLIGERRRTRVLMLGRIAAGNVELDVAEAQRSKALGYVAFKVKVGTGDPRADADRTRRVCEALGPGVLRCSDANQGWSVDQALEYVHALDGSVLDFFEQPVMADDLEGMAKIAAATDIAISCDEGVHSAEDLKRHHESRAARGATLKAGKLGGLRGVIDAAALCEALGMKLNLAAGMSESGIANAAVLHLAAAVPSLDWGLSPTSHYLAEDLLTKPLLFANGHAEVPKGPGLGIEVDERQVRKFTINR